MTRDTSAAASQVGNGIVEPTQLPLYGTLASLFLQENFMPDGGYLGVHTSHAYPHTSTSSCLPATLKGSDMAAWETFRSLGCSVRLRSVIELPEWFHYGHDSSEPCPAADLTDESSEGYDEEVEDGGLEASESGADHSVIHMDKMQALQGDGDQVMDECSVASTSESNDLEIGTDELHALQQERKEYLSLPTAEFRGLEPQGLLVPRREDDLDENATAAEFEQIGQPAGCRLLSNGLLFCFYPNDNSPVEDETEMVGVLNKWMAKRSKGLQDHTEQQDRVLYEKVAWLNRSGPYKEPQIAYAAYGNEANAAMMYSTCGIVAKISPYTTRKALLGMD
ncbi:hypothetical protein N8I77_002639 [Diaporthe amygdali]|uniref:Uncharacterized protein n=1 Tax=Phomopsis amygdali TaxID=1214568 RepID=A0AAD9WAJ4_PHOAM|nr:hypothetical protein N8I77_002639 [Diaporthe amygdali]